MYLHYTSRVLYYKINKEIKQMCNCQVEEIAEPLRMHVHVTKAM